MLECAGMSRPAGSLLYVLSFTAIASAQCPRINFQGPGQQTMVNAPRGATMVSGLQRMPDGSFTQHIFTGNIPTRQSSKVGTVPHDEQNFLTCVGLPSRTRHPGPPHIATDQLGTTAETSVVTDLTGGGVGSFVFLTPYAPLDEIAVGLLDSDITGGTAKYYKVGRSPQNLIAADFNGDGKHDAAVVYSGPGDGITPGGVSVMLGNGDGTLQAAVNYPAGNYTTSATAFDLNNDGKVDLAVTNFNDNNVEVMLGNGDGTFRAPVPYTLPVRFAGIAGFPTSVAAADINGDGKPDLIVGTVNGVAILFGAGDGTFPTSTLLNVSVLGPLVAAGDFNKDGKIDVAITDFYDGILYTFLNTGGGQFSSPTAYTVTQSIDENAFAANPGNFFVEDFDGDGNIDLVFAGGHPDGLVPDYHNQKISVLYGNGDGTFAGTSYYVPPSLFILNVAVGDFNGDGKPDLASGIQGQSFYVRLGRGDGSFQAAVTTTLSNGSITYIAAADVNGDGKADALLADRQGTIDVLISNGDGTFAAPQLANAGSNPIFIATGDFNRDGKLDLVIVNGGSGGAQNTVSVLLGTGGGAFGPPISFSAGSVPQYIAVSDLNQDGNPDLIVTDFGANFDTTNPGGVWVLLGNGDGTFKPAVKYATALNPVWVQPGDFNGDGKIDLIAAASLPTFDYTLVELKGNGDGTFQNGVQIPTGFGPSAVVAGDFDGDGNQDLVVSHCCGIAATTYLTGNGDGTFQNEVEFSFLSVKTMAAADFNGDGKPDIAFSTKGGRADGAGLYFNVTTAPQLGTTSGAGFKLPPVAPNSIVTSFGSDLANTRSVAAAGTDPATLGGTSISVADSTGAAFQAGLFFVDPLQVNYLMPAVASGTATISVTSGDGTVTAGTVAIAPVAPSIFTLNANNLAAAIPVLYHSDGTYAVSQVFALDSTGAIVAAPIDLGSATDQLYLSVYGTGLRGASQANVTASANGVTLPVQFVGATSQYPGEDQVNVLLPRNLIGAGGVTMNLSANGIAANAVTFSIK